MFEKFLINDVQRLIFYCIIGIKKNKRDEKIMHIIIGLIGIAVFLGLAFLLVLTKESTLAIRWSVTCYSTCICVYFT